MIKDFSILRCPLEGSNIIEASAGTGKTHAIAGLFLRLVLEKGYKAEEILVVSFTVAATGELRERIRRLLSETSGVMKGAGSYSKENEVYRDLAEKFSGDPLALLIVEDSIRNFDMASISTIHGFCQRMLLENAFESMQMFGTDLVPDQSGLTLEIAEDFWRMHIPGLPELVIQHLMKKGCTPGYFAGLLGIRANKPGFRVIPDPGPVDIDEREKTVTSMFKALGHAWKNSREELSEIFNSSGDSLNRTKYKQGNISIYFFEADTYVNETSLLDAPKSLVKFTGSYIEEAVKKGRAFPQHSFFQLCGDFLAELNGFIIILDEYFKGLLIELMEFGEKEWAERNRARNTRSYRDILSDMDNALSRDPESPLARAVRKRYRAALVDEFQDTDPVQFSIFSTIFRHDDSILFLIGDPKQAIYRFRGGDIFAYMKALEDMGNIYTLKANWRSDPGLIHAVNTIFSGVTNPFVYEKIGFTPAIHGPGKGEQKLVLPEDESAPFTLCFIGKSHYGVESKKRISKWRAEELASESVAAEISRLVDMGKKGKAHISGVPVAPGHMAVLVRKKTQALKVRDRLGVQGIPAVLYGSESVFQTDEAGDILDVMSAVAGPENEMLVKAALVTDVFGRSIGSLLREMEDEARWDETAALFSYYRELWGRHNFITMLSSILIKEKARSRMMQYRDGERRITNILHCAEIIQKAEDDHALGHEALIAWLSEKIIEDSSAENQIRLESDETAVKIVTIHRSKGLDFPIVFCPFMWEGSEIDERDFRNRRIPFFLEFHDKKNGWAPVLDLGSGDKENLMNAGKEELAENIRLLYVGLTRARHRCYLYHGMVNDSGTSALSYLMHRPAGLDGEDVISGLKFHWENLGVDNMLRDLGKITTASQGVIDIRLIDDIDKTATSPFTPGGNGAGQASGCRKFTGAIDRAWGLSSYSSITAGIDHGAHHDQLGEHGTGDSVNSDVFDAGILSFPGGTVSGSLIHEIFEAADFADKKEGALEALVAEKIVKYGFEERWRDVLCAMVRNVLNAGLDDALPDLRLGNIRRGERLSELEFYFPVGPVTREGLVKVFREIISGGLAGEFSSYLDRLNFRETRGFMHGFIDLVFIHGGKYYIVDWKSNRLGSSIDDFGEQGVLKEMMTGYYIIQYYFYTAALHRYLALRLPGYDYETHFGGVYYIFIRGISPDRGPGHGIFRDRPGKDKVEMLLQYLNGGGD